MRGSHLLLYDRECCFCHWIVRFVLARDRRAVFTFAALQSEAAADELAPFGGRPADLTTFYVIENYQSSGPALQSRAGAVLVVAECLGWPWSAASVLRTLPGVWLDVAYNLVARRRHGILGGNDTCVIPQPEDRWRFLDSDGAAAR